MNINRYIDHTILKAEATTAQVQQICYEAMEYDFYSVCVNSSFVGLVKSTLKDSNVKIAAVVGFPLGAMSTNAKAFETDDVCQNGADEIDMVLNIGALKEQDYEYVLQDIATVVTIAAKHNATVKVIIEACLLTEEEKIKACQLSVAAGAAFVKTSTGFSTGGATVEDVALMKQVVGDKCQVKASGGIRDFKTAKAMIDAGATRIGASASVEIYKEGLAE